MSNKTPFLEYNLGEGIFLTVNKKWVPKLLAFERKLDKSCRPKTYNQMIKAIRDKK